MFVVGAVRIILTARPILVLRSLRDHGVYFRVAPCVSLTRVCRVLDDHCIVALSIGKVRRMAGGGIPYILLLGSSKLLNLPIEHAVLCIVELLHRILELLDESRVVWGFLEL